MEADLTLPRLQVRLYGTQVGDYQMVDEWWRARHHSAFRENMIPPLGLIVERGGSALAAVWAYESYGIGVAFMEYLVTRPGIGAKMAGLAVSVGIESIKGILKQRGFSVLRCIADDRTARFAKAFGFQGNSGFSNIFTII